MTVLAACVKEECRRAAALSFSSSSGPNGQGQHSGQQQQGGGGRVLCLGGDWSDSVYDGLKSWVLVALCDPSACGLAAQVVEAFCVHSPSQEAIARDPLLLPSLKLCFPQGGGAGNSQCENVFGTLLRRVAGAGSGHRDAVKQLLADAQPPVGSPLAALAQKIG